MQRAVGIDVFSGGEYRRSGWSAAIRESVKGLVPNPDPTPNRLLGTWQGPHGDLANASTAASGGITGGMVAGKIRQVRRLAGEEAAFLKRHAPGHWKMTMPGALSAAGQLWRAGVTDQFYASRHAFVYDIVDMLR